jgi:hypothetical protein
MLGFMTGGMQGLEELLNSAEAWREEAMRERPTLCII